MSRRHVVQRGEGISAIALKYGFAPETVWKAAENDELRELRVDGDVLMPGDVVFVPDRRDKTVVCETAKRHSFRRVGVPAMVQIQLYRDRTARSEEPFELYADGALLVAGTTNEEGIVKAWVPPAARFGRLVVGEEGQEISLTFGGLHPLSEVSGVQQRLRQLGFFRGEVDGVVSKGLKVALRAFQKFAGLPVTAKIDERTRERLGELHDKPANLKEG